MSDYTRFDPANPPPPLETGEPDSFARMTMMTRIPAIVHHVLADHAGRYPGHIKRALQDLENEIVEDKPVRPLHTDAPDGESWAKAWTPNQNRTWLNVAWFFAEAYFYRRLLEAAGYFSQSEWAGVDPFLPRKQAELRSDSPWQLLSLALKHAKADTPADFRRLLHHCLWGNRVDLSYSKIVQATGRQIVVDSEQVNLLVDDTESMLAHLNMSTCPRIDFICDNAGTELLMDLALADYLLKFDRAGHVVLHVKMHPTFVSDATPADVDMAVAAIQTQPGVNLRALGARLKDYRAGSRLRVQADPFWNSSRFFWDLPQPLRADLAQAHLVIIKGDANYRRLLGDSRWPATVPALDAIPYFPAPLVALRTMKSAPVVGLKPGQATALQRLDPGWRVNGQRGMIQTVL